MFGATIDLVFAIVNEAMKFSGKDRHRLRRIIKSRYIAMLGQEFGDESRTCAIPCPCPFHEAHRQRNRERGRRVSRAEYMREYRARKKAERRQSED